MRKYILWIMYHFAIITLLPFCDTACYTHAQYHNSSCIYLTALCFCWIGIGVRHLILYFYCSAKKGRQCTSYPIYYAPTPRTTFHWYAATSTQAASASSSPTTSFLRLNLVSWQALPHRIDYLPS